MTTATFFYDNEGTVHTRKYAYFYLNNNYRRRFKSSVRIPLNWFMGGDPEDAGIDYKQWSLSDSSDSG